MSSDLFSQIVNDRGSFERLLTKIPGFKGYMDRADRRTADRMLRDHLAREIAARINRMAQIERQLVDKGGLKYMSKTNSAKTKIQTYHDRVKAAAPGYSGFFESIKVDEEELDLLYGFDELQTIYVDRLSGALDTLEQAVDSNSGIDEAIDGLNQVAIEANEAFSKREDVLTNISATS